MHQTQTTIKRKILKPLFLTFPFLDRLPIPSRQRARHLIDDLATQLRTKVPQSHDYAHES